MFTRKEHVKYFLKPLNAWSGPVRKIKTLHGSFAIKFIQYVKSQKDGSTTIFVALLLVVDTN